jgi:large-conductance mechanosensitive channel
MQQTIAKSFKDLFSGTVLAFMAKTTVISLAVTAVVVWLVNDLLTGFVKGYLSWIPWEWLQTSGAAVATVAIAYTIFILIHAVVTSLMIEPLLIKLAKKEYPEVPVVGTADISTSVLLSLKAGMVFLLLFLFTFPIMFIPLIGAVWM